MVSFVIGLFIGSNLGVFFVCLLQAGRDNREDELK